MKKVALILLNMGMIFSIFAQYPNMRIANVQVTPENQDNITSDYISGTVRYDSASRTLVLQNATIYRYDSGDPYDDSNGHTLRAEAHSGQTLNIELIGQNTIYGIVPLDLFSGSYNIVGNGSLVLNGITRGIDCGLGVDTFRIRQGASVVIDVPYHPADGFQGAAQYQDYSQTVLIVDSSTLIIDADYCIRRIVGFQLNGSCIVSPAGAHYDSENKTLVTADGPVRDFLEIRPGTVGIPEHASVEWQAWGVEGGIHLHGIKEHSSVEIINMLGQVVCRTLLESTETYIPMKSGVYIVRGDNSAVKVFVK